MRNRRKTITTARQYKQSHQNQFLMKTGTLRMERRTPAKARQQSTTQTKPSVVIQPRPAKDLARKISNTSCVRVLRKRPLVASSTAQSVKLSLKPSRGEQPRAGKVIRVAQRLEQIKVITDSPSFFPCSFDSNVGESRKKETGMGAVVIA